MLDPAYGVGSWVWDRQTTAHQVCHFWKSFEIPKDRVITDARLQITADNIYRLYLDGRELGTGVEWQNLTEYDLIHILSPGKHVIAVEGINDYFQAGLLVGLRVKFSQAFPLEIGTDSTWRLVPLSVRGWEKARQASPGWPTATVVGALGSPPWGAVFNRCQALPLFPLEVHFWQATWFQVTLLSLCAAAVLVCVHLLCRLATQSRLQQVVQLERARIARDIHDDLTARLTELVLMGELAQSKLPLDTPARQQIDKLCGKTRGLLRALNEIIWTVNSQRDTFKDFVFYASKHAETFLKSTSIRCRLDLDEEIPPLACDLGVRRNLFLAIKEALNNAVRHSGATEVILRIHRQGQDVVVDIEDDGKGFDPVGVDRERNGLSNMARQVAEAGGTCHINSQPGAGCHIEFRAPVVRPQRRPFQWRRPSRRPPLPPEAPPGNAQHN